MRTLKILLIIFSSVLVLEIITSLVIFRVQNNEPKEGQNINFNNVNSGGVNLSNTNPSINSNSAVNQALNLNTNSGSAINTNLAVQPTNNNLNRAVGEIKEEEFIFTLEAKTDKKIYSSGEQILLEINLLSNRDFNNLTVIAQGVVSQYGHEYISESQTISLPENQPQKISFVSTLPTCSSCSGVSPGDYEIKITAATSGQTVKTSSVNITLKP